MKTAVVLSPLSLVRFWLTFGALLFALSSFAHAQQTGKAYRVGYLSPGPVNELFLERLRELGYVEGKKLFLSTALKQPADTLRSLPSWSGSKWTAFLPWV